MLFFLEDRLNHLTVLFSHGSSDSLFNKLEVSVPDSADEVAVNLRQPANAFLSAVDAFIDKVDNTFYFNGGAFFMILLFACLTL